MNADMSIICRMKNIKISDTIQTAVLFLVMGVLAACGQSAAANPAATAENRVPVTFVSPTAPSVTATPFPTDTPSPTATPFPTPTATAIQPSPTIAPPVPTATVTPTPVPSPRPMLTGGEPAFPATRLVIPTLEIDAPVEIAPIRAGIWDVSGLEQAVGHLQGTSSPGETGNVVLAGHITLPPDGRAGPFYRLGGLKPGDRVEVYRGEERFVYEIDGATVVSPSDVQVAYPTRSPRLTLITCQSYDKTLAEYTERLVVFGHLVSP